ncbi:type IV conjugative transfer system protein TraL [Acinetobacter baumannii]|uniref:type IV conjugative transfer system protein TraL n=1 Tax=Acinetobacter baumannii TaxID=470 RepID=UPI00385EA919
MLANDTDDTYIPRTINAGPVVFLWNADTFSLWVIVFFIFAMLGNIVVGAILGSLAVKAWARLKEEDGAGLVIRLIYWFFWSSFLARGNAPISEIKEYIG